MTRKRAEEQRTGGQEKPAAREAGAAADTSKAGRREAPERRTGGHASNAGRVSTGLPEAFFRRVVPSIDDLTELKVTLHLYWRIRDRRRGPPFVSRSELLEDRVLSESVKAPGRKAGDLIGGGLEKAVGRGTVLQVTSGDEAWYLLADEEGRRAAKAIEAGEIALKGGSPLAEAAVLKRPNIFALYEQNIGLLQPLIAEELREAESRYPAEWVEEAFKIAVEQNVRRWRYIHRILERWAEEGRGDRGAEPGSQESRYRYVRGKYADIVKR